MIQEQTILNKINDYIIKNDLNIGRFGSFATINATTKGVIDDDYLVVGENALIFAIKNNYKINLSPKEMEILVKNSDINHYDQGREEIIDQRSGYRWNGNALETFILTGEILKTNSATKEYLIKNTKYQKKPNYDLNLVSEIISSCHYHEVFNEKEMDLLLDRLDYSEPNHISDAIGAALEFKKDDDLAKKIIIKARKHGVKFDDAYFNNFFCLFFNNNIDDGAAKLIKIKNMVREIEAEDAKKVINKAIKKGRKKRFKI